ncbi:MAG TPA: hypothetical protein VMD91_09435 [Candidatus Sulfotelmatobacter sp.]|nr:hypothetical protein [Candidatus Sulfotelmatobacter sp.]
MLALLLAFAIPTYGPIPQPRTTFAGLKVPTADGEAVIANSGSTNTGGYVIRVYADGTVSVDQGVPIRKTISKQLVTKFFDDLHAAGPLDALPTAACMKSASFGSSTRVGYHAQLSPDLSCPSTSSIGRALTIDVNAIVNAAGVSMLPRSRSFQLQPQ